MAGLNRRELKQTVVDLVNRSFPDDDADVADAILADRDVRGGSFSYLVDRLSEVGGGTLDGIVNAWLSLAERVDERLMNRIVDGGIDNPPVYLAALLETA
jgi:hypothetical protein